MGYGSLADFSLKSSDCTRHSIMLSSGVILPWTTLDVLKLREKITKEVTVCTHMRKVIDYL